MARVWLVRAAPHQRGTAGAGEEEEQEEAAPLARLRLWGPARPVVAHRARPTARAGRREAPGPGAPTTERRRDVAYSSRWTLGSSLSSADGKPGRGQIEDACIHFAVARWERNSTGISPRRYIARGLVPTRSAMSNAACPPKTHDLVKAGTASVAGVFDRAFTSTFAAQTICQVFFAANAPGQRTGHKMRRSTRR